MKTRTVCIVVYYRNAGNCYTREAMTAEKMEDFKKYGSHFLFFEIESDQNLQKVNDIWYAEIDTMHPEMIEWRQPEFPVMAGCIRRGSERGGYNRRNGGPKPCPFTGILPNLIEYKGFNGTTTYRYQVQKHGIKVTTESFSTIKEATCAWNRRVR